MSNFCWIINLALIHPYSSLWARINVQALIDQHWTWDISIWPWFTLIQPCEPIFHVQALLISTGHETSNLALIHPYSTLWTCMWCPGINWPALNMRHLICPDSPLFNLVGPYLMSRHWLTSTEHETINLALIRPDSTVWAHMNPYLMSRHWLISTGHETINLALICPYLTLWTCI